MAARITAHANLGPTAPRFDAKFIEDHRLIERYLNNQLPRRGAVDLENWCRAHPEYLDALKLADRAQATLKLLEECGRPLDLSPPHTPWWKTPYASVGLGLIAILSLVALWVALGKVSLLRSELDDARTRLRQGSLVQPATETSVRVTPDRAPGVDRADIVVNSGTPQLMDLHIDMGYSKAVQFRLIVDKREQGRALIVNNLVRDSNGELRLTVNTTGLSAGAYAVRIEALPLRGGGAATPEGWLLLEVR
jgi:hypothetical protein